MEVAKRHDGIMQDLFLEQKTNKENIKNLTDLRNLLAKEKEDHYAQVKEHQNTIKHEQNAINESNRQHKEKRYLHGKDVKHLKNLITHHQKNMRIFDDVVRKKNELLENIKQKQNKEINGSKDNLRITIEEASAAKMNAMTVLDAKERDLNEKEKLIAGKDKELIKREFDHRNDVITFNDQKSALMTTSMSFTKKVNQKTLELNEKIEIHDEVVKTYKQKAKNLTKKRKIHLQEIKKLKKRMSKFDRENEELQKNMEILAREKKEVESKRKRVDKLQKISVRNKSVRNKNEKIKTIPFV